MISQLTFFHPDYTVGTGITPDRAHFSALVGSILLGMLPPVGNRERIPHPAPKVYGLV
jgi:hypothetical protein